MFEPDRHTGLLSSRSVAGAQKPAFTRTGGSDLIMTAADRFVGIDSSQGHLDVAVTPGDQTFTHPNTEAGIQKLIHRSWPEAKRPR